MILCSQVLSIPSACSGYWLPEASAVRLIRRYRVVTLADEPFPGDHYHITTMDRKLAGEPVALVTKKLHFSAAHRLYRY